MATTAPRTSEKSTGKRTGASRTATRPATASQAKTSAAATRASRSTGRTAAGRTAASRNTASRTAASGTASRTTASRSRSRATTSSRGGTVGAYAERAVLIPVGAALIARERLIDGVGTIVSPSATQAQLDRFERRGHTARGRLEREARRTQVRLERELRRRKRELDKAVGGLDRRRETVRKSIADQVDQTSTSIEARIKDGASLASKLQDRVKDLAA